MSYNRIKPSGSTTTKNTKNQGIRTVKKGINVMENRTRRFEQANALRKSQREDSMQSRRRIEDLQDEKGNISSSSFQTVEEKMNYIQELKHMIESNDSSIQVDGTTRLRRLLSISKDPPIQEVLESGMLPRLVSFLSCFQFPILQFETLWALTNIASGTTPQVQELLRYDVIPTFIHLVGSPHEDVREQAIWVLGNIAGDSAPYRDEVLKQGALHAILQVCGMMKDIKIGTLKNITWTISNFARGVMNGQFDPPDFDLLRPALPVLAQLIHIDDEDVLTDACWGLSYLADDRGAENIQIQAVLNVGVMKRLVELLLHASPKIQIPALRAVGNIIAGDKHQTQAALDVGAVSALGRLLVHTKKNIRKEATWSLSNVMAGTSNQIQEVLNAHLIPPLLEILAKDDYEVQKEAMWAISNATSGGTHNQIIYLGEFGCLPPLCRLLDCTEVKVILLVLDAIENVLKSEEWCQTGEEPAAEGSRFQDKIEECGGIRQIEMLQRHENQDIYTRAQRILCTYFDAKEISDVPFTSNEQEQREEKQSFSTASRFLF
ncbi:MAG: hypothetical protein Sylvanvirus3_2 [Sylvanvirus sp.]|uniref:IBB domain-containing protein n=1 Tax=Sylvanvirus sp. TaxID=2487774 RepID=A0A3G5AHD2_9VIRU|nr:MAG: hypothetical protein Sylvanvirus3_2 [Sylvanvirus sp.]